MTDCKQLKGFIAESFLLPVFTSYWNTHSCLWRLHVHICEVTVVMRLTWGTLKADVVVRADTAVGLFLVDAPETLLQTGVNHFPCVCCRHPVCSASFHGCGSCTNSLPVIKTYRFQALIVSISPRMVNVEPRCPLCHTWRKTWMKIKAIEG